MNIRTSLKGSGFQYVSGGRTARQYQTNRMGHTGTGVPVGTSDMYPNYAPFMGSRDEDTEYPTSGRA